MSENGLLVVAHLDPKKRGSLEQQMAAVAKALGRRGIPTHLVLARAPAPSVAEELSAAGATWSTVDFGNPREAAARVREEIAARRPSLAHLHFLRPLSPIARAVVASGVPTVLNDHLALAPPRSSPLERLAKRALYRLAAAHPARRIAVSAHVAATVRDAENESTGVVRVIANGVDLARFEGLDRAAARRALELPPDGTVIACVARMAHEKGVDVALRALALLKRPGTLVVVGDGPDRAQCAGLAAELGIAPRVRFLGLRDDVEQALAACDQVWIPSRVPEAFGLAAAEAMAAGRPVVASRAGGLPEVVAEGVTGLLAPPGDPAALASAARWLVDNAERARAMGEAGRARARVLFGLDRFVERTLGLYIELVPAWALALARSYGTTPPTVEAAAGGL